MPREKLSEVFPETIRRLAEKVSAPVPSWYAGQLHEPGADRPDGSTNGNGAAHANGSEHGPRPAAPVQGPQ
jgi:hypothetical protein